MAIELYWDNDEQTIMLAEFYKGWTWAQMFETLAKIKDVTSKRNEIVGAIVWMEPGANVPNGSVFSRETRDYARQMLQMGAEGRGPIAIVGMNGFVKTVAKAFTILDRKALNGVHFADTIDEARAELSRRLLLIQETSA